MHILCRLVRWAVFLGCVTAVGGCVFFWVRHRPRCTIVGPLETIHLSSDGSRLVTRNKLPNHDKHVPKEPGWTVYYGPLQVWDTHNGRVIHEWLHDATVRWPMMSPDGRHIAIVTGDGRIGGGDLWLVDSHTGQEWRFDEPKDVNRLEFSPKGRWLIVNTASGDPGVLIDVAAHEVGMRLKDSWPRISRDDKVFYVRKGPARHLTVWDPEAGKALGVVPITSAHCDISLDGRLLLEHHIEPIPEPPEERDGVRIRFGGGMRKDERKDYRVDIWDLATLKHRSHHAVKLAGNLQSSFSPDGRLLVMWLRQEKKASNLDMIDTTTGQRLWTYVMNDGYSCEFSPDGSLCAFVHGQPKEMMTMFEAVSGRVLWQRPASYLSYFARSTDILLHKDDDLTPFMFLDAATGEPKATIPPTFTTHNYIPMLTPDGQHFVIGGWQQRNREPFAVEAWLDKRWPDLFGNGSEGALVMESATGRELFRVLKRDGHSHELSADASTLITIEPLDNPGAVHVIRAWDVHPTKAWIWAVGAAVGGGLIGRFVLLPLVQRCRNRNTPKAA